MKSLVALPALLASLALAQPSASVFTKQDLMIPMRDGVKLHTLVFTPKNAAAPLPILFERTPYGALDREKILLARYPELTAAGYIFAFHTIPDPFTSEVPSVTHPPFR